MQKIRKLLSLYKLALKDTRGVSAVEYTVIIALGAFALSFAWANTGTQLTNLFETVSSTISGSSVVVADEGDSAGADESASSDNDSDSDSDSDGDLG